MLYYGCGMDGLIDKVYAYTQIEFFFTDVLINYVSDENKKEFWHGWAKNVSNDSLDIWAYF